MSSIQLRRPPAPTPVERARSMITRRCEAAVVGVECAGRVVPLVHHVHPDGTASLLLDEDHPLVAEVGVARRDELPAMLELFDRAPVALREPTRGLLWLTGWLREPHPELARRLALAIADAIHHPELLDLGHGATLLRLYPATAVLADAEGTALLALDELAQVRPDPFADVERDWLRHLEEAHPEVFYALRRHLPPTLRALADMRIRPLGVDRYGLRLRLETGEGDHDVRLAFEHPVETIEGLRTQVGLLVGCQSRITP